MQLARNVGIVDRVRFLGRLEPEELRKHYQAADATVLASSREGWANVLLESMACGTRVVATDVWGTPEVVRNATAGVLVRRDAESIALGLAELFDTAIPRKETRTYAEGFSWDETSKGQMEVFLGAIEKARLPAAG